MTKDELRILKAKMEKEHLRALAAREEAIELERRYRKALVALYGPPPALEKC